MKRLTILLMLALPALGLSTPAPGLVVHEWGTFTSVAGKDGVPVEWRPLRAPDDLPGFVYGSGGVRGQERRELFLKFDLRGLVRMETPVLYFYADEPMEASARVEFPKGFLTEWYPAAKEVKRGLDWGRFRVEPKGEGPLPMEAKPSHCYPARETDAALLRVGKETEKLLFYRGVGFFPLPLRVTMDARQVTLKNVGPEVLARAFVVESRGGKVGFRALKDVLGEATVERPELLAGPKELQQELVKALVASGLYEKEALAMVKTWEDSWFEDGVRVLYLMPTRKVDEVLPLMLDPKPAELVRVFVGRAEVITPELEQAARAVVTAAEDSSRLPELKRNLAKLGRFGEPALRGLAVASADPQFQTRVYKLLAP